MAYLPKTRSQYHDAVGQQHTAAKNQIDIVARIGCSLYQKMMFSTTKSTAMTPAHTIGF